MGVLAVFAFFERRSLVYILVALSADPDESNHSSKIGLSRHLIFLATLFVVVLQQVGIGLGDSGTGSTLLVSGIYHYFPEKPFSHGYTGVNAASTSGSKSSGLGLVPVTVVI